MGIPWAEMVTRSMVLVATWATAVAVVPDAVTGTSPAAGAVPVEVQVKVDEVSSNRGIENVVSVMLVNLCHLSSDVFCDVGRMPTNMVSMGHLRFCNKTSCSATEHVIFCCRCTRINVKPIRLMKIFLCT